MTAAVAAAAADAVRCDRAMLRGAYAAPCMLYHTGVSGRTYCIRASAGRVPCSLHVLMRRFACMLQRTKSSTTARTDITDKSKLLWS